MSTGLATRIKDVTQVIERICGEKGRPVPRIVAVSKLKPAEGIAEAYRCGLRCFGENYVNELHDKAVRLQNTCPDIEWHFIGHLQGNKVAKLLSVPHLTCIETLDSIKLANELQKRLEAIVGTDCHLRWDSDGLAVFVQVNTSGELNKAGLNGEEQVYQLCLHIRENCDRLRFRGLMTIGSLEASKEPAYGGNTDFECLVRYREAIAKRLGLKDSDLELSMGMSLDFEEAIRMGSSNVRVGSRIFGSRTEDASN